MDSSAWFEPTAASTTPVTHVRPEPLLIDLRVRQLTEYLTRDASQCKHALTAAIDALHAVLHDHRAERLAYSGSVYCHRCLKPLEICTTRLAIGRALSMLGPTSL